MRLTVQKLIPPVRFYCLGCNVSLQHRCEIPLYLYAIVCSGDNIMHSVKRIEIIANSFELGKVLAAKQAGVSGYMVIRNVARQGFIGGSKI